MLLGLADIGKPPEGRRGVHFYKKSDSFGDLFGVDQLILFFLNVKSIEGHWRRQRAVLPPLVKMILFV